MANSKVALPPIPTWKPKFGKANLERKLGTREFDRGFRMQAITEGELTFPGFANCYQSQMVLGDVIRRRLPTYIGVDLSSDTRPGNAIVATALDVVSQMRIPVEVRYGAWSSPETARQIHQVVCNHQTEYIVVENNAYQQAIIDWTKEDKQKYPWWIHVEAHTTGRGKADPRYGMPGLALEFYNKGWAIPSGEWAGHDGLCECYWCEWKRQVSMYPRGQQTDFAMATWFSQVAITRWGRTFGGNLGSMRGLNDR